MAETRTIQSGNLNTAPSIKVDKEILFSLNGKGECSNSEFRKKQSVSEMEDIVNKLINHIKDNC